MAGTGEGHHGTAHRRPVVAIRLAGALAVGVAGALAGYWIGRRWGPRLLSSPSGAGPARSASTRWAGAHVRLGYAAGAGWRQVHHLTGQVGLLLAGAVLVALAVAWLVHRPARGYEDEPVQPVAAGRRPD